MITTSGFTVNDSFAVATLSVAAEFRYTVKKMLDRCRRSRQLETIIGARSLRQVGTGTAGRLVEFFRHTGRSMPKNGLIFTYSYIGINLVIYKLTGTQV